MRRYIEKWSHIHYLLLINNNNNCAIQKHNDILLRGRIPQILNCSGGIKN